MVGEDLHELCPLKDGALLLQLKKDEVSMVQEASSEVFRVYKKFDSKRGYPGRVEVRYLDGYQLKIRASDEP